MKAEFKINVAAILILVVGIALFFWLRGNKNKEIEMHLNTIAHNEFVFESWKSEVDSLDIVQQQALDVSAEALKQALTRDSIAAEMIEYYKSLSQVVKIETVFETDTVTLTVPIYIDKDSSVVLGNDCFQANLSLFNGGLSLDGLTIDNTQDIVIGDKRTGLFKTDQYISIHNTNPCLTVTGMQTYNIVYKKSWWENPLVTVPIGIAVGVIGAQLIK